MKVPQAVRRAAAQVYDAQTRRLYRLRYSFITTPGKIYRVLSSAKDRPQLIASAWTSASSPRSQWLTSFYILVTISVVALSIGSTLAIGYGLAALQNFDVATFRPRRPATIDVVAWASFVGVLSSALGWVVFTTADEIGASWTEVAICIGAGLGVLVASVVVVVFGAVMSVAWWKMAVGVWQNLYWPAGLDEPRDT